MEKKPARAVALLPIGVFLVLYLGLGCLFEYGLKIEMGFYNIPIVVAFLAAILVACLQNRALSFDEKLEVMAKGVDKDGKVTGVNILSHSETAGLGANAVKESFRDQFVGLVKGITVSKDKPGENSIDALTGATVTSRAVTKAVNAAIEAAGGENDG